MEIHSKTINGIKFFIKADNFLISQAQVLFRAIQSIPPDKIRDGYKIEIGFSVFICESINGGYKIVVPDYTNSPLLNTTDDLTIALWVLFEQTELLNYLGIDGVATRFDDEIVIAKNVLEYPTISLQRYSDLGKDVSGWCIEKMVTMDDFYMQMKKNEEYIIWNPENITFTSANYTEIIEDEDLKFVINCDDMTLEIIFSGIVLNYMYSEQGTRMTSWSIAQEKYNDKFYFRKNPVYKVENSLLIKWVLIESCGFYSETDLTHYCIVTGQDVVDIISMCEPTYRIISAEI